MKKEPLVAIKDEFSGPEPEHDEQAHIAWKSKRLGFDAGVAALSLAVEALKKIHAGPKQEGDLGDWAAHGIVSSQIVAKMVLIDIGELSSSIPGSPPPTPSERRDG